MFKKLFPLSVFVIGFILFPYFLSAAAPFYEGKTVRIIVGYSPGGGYDAYSRLIARHLGKHIPGHPTVIVDNMPGAGSLIAANHIFRVAKPDGLSIAHFNGGHFFGQIFGQPGIEFDARKFEFIGAPGRDDVAFIRLAAESGELAGSAWWWESIKATWRKGLETGEVFPVLQAVPRPLPDLPKIPLAINLAKTERGASGSRLESTVVASLPVHMFYLLVHPKIEWKSSARHFKRPLEIRRLLQRVRRPNCLLFL
jgi:hypothetical protein